MMNNQRETPLLSDSDWFIPSAMDIPNRAASWLHDKGSTTAKFKQQSQHFRLECCFEGQVPVSVLSNEAHYFPHDESLWLREVLLHCDGQPWLYGRTLIPRSTLEDAGLALATLETTPLGERLFNQTAKAQRDLIELAAIIPPPALGDLLAPPFSQPQLQHWWARRSRLTVGQNPLLLTEVFLPCSPLYGTTLLAP